MASLKERDILIMLAVAGVGGWFLAGQPTSLEEFKNNVFGKGSGLGGGAGGKNKFPLPSLNGAGGGPGGPGGMPPWMLAAMMGGGGPGGPGGPPGGPGGPGGSQADAQNMMNQMNSQMQQQQQQMQNQMSQQAQQQQMQQQQQQFQDQLTQQQNQAQMAQMQQQMQAQQQAAQQQAAGAAAMQQQMPQQPQTTNPATGTTAGTPTTDPTQQQQQQLNPNGQPAPGQMLPSATAPGVLPQQQGMDPTQAMAAQQMQMQQQQSPYGMMAAPSPYGYAPASPYGYAPATGYLPPVGTPLQNMFAATPNYMGNYENVNVNAPTYSHGMQPVARTGSGYVARPGYQTRSGMTHRGYLGIVDGDQKPHKKHRFYNNHQDLMQRDLGDCYPGMHGIKLIDLVMSTPSKNADEIFPKGVNPHDFGSFQEDVNVYITRILEHMAGFNPEEKVNVLKGVLKTYSETHPFDSKFYPDPFAVSSPLATVPKNQQIVRSGVPKTDQPGVTYINDDGFMLPNKYAALQFTGSNSMPPMIHKRSGDNINYKQKSLFFNV